MRYYYSLIPTGMRIISNEGWGLFWFKLRRKVVTSSSYRSWIVTNEATPQDIENQRTESLSFKFRPKISIITPVWNSDIKYLRLAIDSVINQTYDNWELCIADGKSDKPEIKQILQEYAGKDSRIKVKFLTENKGISGNSNEALSLSSGEFIGLLDHDDELAPCALYEAIRALTQNKSWDFIYSDEDKIDLRQNRYDPFFKPDWSPDMLLSTMYTCHLSIYRKGLVDALGGFRPDYDGSQDYDLALRAMEKTDKIYHIPWILYHWRMTPGSTATSSKNKEYADKAGRMALADYLLRNEIRGTVPENTQKGLYRAQREIVGNPLVSIIIPTKDRVKVLKQCITSIFKYTDYPNYEILIVDNESLKSQELLSYYDEIKKQPKVRIIQYDGAFNFAALNNFAVSKTSGAHLMFLNNDTQIISREWLTAMLEHSQRKEVGAVGAKLLYRDGTIQHCGIILGHRDFSGHVYRRSRDHPGYFGRVGIINNYSAVTGACMMIRKEVFDEMSGFDENLAVDYNDIDLCLRMRQKGYLIVYTPYAKLYHLESYTRGYSKTVEGQVRHSKELQYVISRWGELLKKGDPYYNPNLSLTRADFSIEKISRSKA